MEDLKDEKVERASEKGKGSTNLPTELRYIQYSHALEKQYLPAIRALIAKDLSEPYSIYVYRYFLHTWGDLCFMALDPSLPSPSDLIGVVINKLDTHTPSLYSPNLPANHPSNLSPTKRGYIAMLATSSTHRKRGIATHLVRAAIDTMMAQGADEIVLETEETNVAAMNLYERLGFLRSKKLWRYYLNGSCAYRLVLQVRDRGDLTGAEEDAGDENGMFA